MSNSDDKAYWLVKADTYAREAKMLNEKLDEFKYNPHLLPKYTEVQKLAAQNERLAKELNDLWNPPVPVGECNAESPWNYVYPCQLAKGHTYPNHSAPQLTSQSWMTWPV